MRTKVYCCIILLALFSDNLFSQDFDFFKNYFNKNHSGSKVQIPITGCSWTFEHNYFPCDTTNVKLVFSQDPNNIWQIGRPLKPHPLDTAVSPPNVLITDTVNPYPANNTSNFTIYMRKPQGAEMACWSYMILEIIYRINTDSLRDGFYVEIYYNGSQQWKNVIFDNMADTMSDSTNTYSSNDTLFNKEPGISYPKNDIGNGWSGFQFVWQWNNANAHLIDSVAIRITFVSDSINTYKGGVLIDYLDFEVADRCSIIGINEVNYNRFFSINPNPIEYESVIEFDEAGIYDITINDMTGRLINKSIINGSEFLIGRLDLPVGIYCYRISNNSDYFNGKFIVQP